MKVNGHNVRKPCTSVGGAGNMKLGLKQTRFAKIGLSAFEGDRIHALRS